MATEAIARFLARYQQARMVQPPLGDMGSIHVDAIAAKFALFYERLRNLIDYQEEHLLRKRFIGRALRRRLLVAITKNVAESLVKDIIRAGHLGNDTVSFAVIPAVQRLVDNFYCLRARAPQDEEFIEWLVEITASAIEEVLFPPTEGLLLGDLMFEVLRSGLTCVVGTLPAEDSEVQLFIAVQRALLRVDDDQLQYRILQFVYPNWKTMSSNDCPAIALELPKLRENIQRLITHPMHAAFFRLANRYNTIFYLLGDIANTLGLDAFAALISDEQALDRAIAGAYEKRFLRERGRLHRLALFSVISFLLSKIVVAVAIEIPIEVAWTGVFSFAHTAANIIAAPLLMLIIVSAIRLPSKENLALVISEFHSVLGFTPSHDYVVVLRDMRHTFSSVALNVFYVALATFVFYGITRALLFLNFSPPSIVVFFIFIALVAATGRKIHNRARELSMAEEKATVGGFLLDIIAMPFVTLGKWIIDGLAHFNIIVVLMNLFIELPFQIFVEFLEHFRLFLEQKKDELH